MSDPVSWNAKTIAEFRANDGRVSGPFEGAPMVLLHHRGRKSGQEFIAPLMYLAAEQDAGTISVFAPKGGAPAHPEWYANIVAAGTTTVEVCQETYPVTVEE